MATSFEHTDAIIGVYVASAVVALLLIICLLWLCLSQERRDVFLRTLCLQGKRRSRRDNRNITVHSTPKAGRHGSPLRVTLTTPTPGVEINVYVARLRDADGEEEVDELFEQAENGKLAFLLYTEDLEFVDGGRYLVLAHTMSADRTRSDTADFVFEVIGTSSTFLAPPRIIPDSGDVTTDTAITILPTELAVAAAAAAGDETGATIQFADAFVVSPFVSVRYSTDDSPPSLPYTGPFRLHIPPHANRAAITIRAICIDAAVRSVSKEAVAFLNVVPGGASFFDPSIAAPTARVLTTGASAYFDQPPLPDTVIVYRIEYVDDARHHAAAATADMLERGGGGGAKAAGAKHSSTVLWDGQAVKLDRDVARIVAWTVDVRDDRVRSDAVIYDVSRQQMSYAPGVGSGGGNALMLAAAAAAGATGPSYANAADLSTASRGGRRSNSNGRIRRAAAAAHQLDSGVPVRALPPPVVCVTCGEVAFAFDEPPVNARLLYTLDGTEPTIDAGDDSMGTFEFRPGGADGGSVLLTRGEYRQVFVTARLFIPVAGSTGEDGGGRQSYRYGHRFYRGFFFTK